uniref:Uncharacterized protein n=1 Tax=Anguilla anguilla TaxID=7936 RepID=A0A0E9QU19_ANGAN
MAGMPSRQITPWRGSIPFTCAAPRVWYFSGFDILHE